MTDKNPMHPDTILADPLAAFGEGDGIGVVGADVPVDVLLASGRPFGHLPWRSSGDTPWADRWLESSFPFWARSILEQWHEGRFDGLDVVVFSRSDDASQRLFYYVSELRRRGLLQGPTPRVFDIALVPRASSVERTARAIAELGQAFGVGPAEIGQGMARANRLRQTLAGIAAARCGDGTFYERLARASIWGDPTQWLDGVDLPVSDTTGCRVLLAGSFPPDERLHEAVESAGGSVIAETHVHGLGRLGEPVAGDAAEPALALAQQLQDTAIGPRAMLDRADWIVARAESARADAVIVWLTREDEAYAWQVPAQQRALAAAGKPALLLPAADWQAKDGALERIAAFVRERVNATA